MVLINRFLINLRQLNEPPGTSDPQDLTAILFEIPQTGRLGNIGQELQSNEEDGNTDDSEAPLGCPMVEVY